jgi:hypothetical protein
VALLTGMQSPSYAPETRQAERPPYNLRRLASSSQSADLLEASNF